MAIQVMATKGNQTLVERMVGAGTQSILYPGIMQCFAIAGWTQREILGTHVSPGFTEDEMREAFEALAAMGGNTVMYWYLLGPFQDHFAIGKAQWHSPRDIKKTFKKHFKNDAATHLILDATAERHTMRMYPGITEPMPFSGINIRVVKNGSTMAFAYQEYAQMGAGWTEFTLTKFVQF